MSIASIIIVALIALLHCYIAWFEMFAWTSRGPRVFKSFPKDLFEPTKAMAFNQGLYNAFLAVGLILALFAGDPLWQKYLASLFLVFVAVAGIGGALTASKRIFFVQTVPAVVGLGLVWFT